MRAEHCTKHGSALPFTTGNYRITTTPLNEWSYVVGDKQGVRAVCPDMTSGRRLPSIDLLLQSPTATKAKLTRAEVIALVLYTGPMVCALSSPRKLPRKLLGIKPCANSPPGAPFARFTLPAVSHIQQHPPPSSSSNLRIICLTRKHFFHYHLRASICGPKAVSLLTHCPWNAALSRIGRQARIA